MIKKIECIQDGWVVSDCDEYGSLFFINESHAQKVAELLKKVSKHPEWVHIRMASFSKLNDGWKQGIHYVNLED